MPAPRKKTAAKKKVASKAVAKRQTTQVASLQDRLKNMTQQQSENVQESQSNKIVIHNESQFKLPDGSIVNAPMSVVVLTFMARNIYYSKAWKEGVVSPADCAAQGFHKNDDLVPYPASDLIDQQAASCGDCRANEYGSHPTSDGKACQNRKQIAVLGVDISEEGEIQALSQEMLRFDTSPIGTGKFDNFVAKVVKRYDRPMCCFVIDADIIPAGGRSHTVIFKNEQLLPENLILEALDRVEEAKGMLDVKPLLKAQDSKAQDSKAQPARRPSKKKAAKRR